MLFLSATDIALITFGIVIAGGFRSFIFLAYYPCLAVFAVVFSSHWLSLAWTTTAAVAYAAVCLIVGSGLDLDAGNEKVLLARLALMHIMVLGISFITRFERIRWQTSVARERELRRERIELSQTIHDTIAQTAYMIGLGIHNARQLADESNEELAAALDATLELSRSAMWEVRGPIDAGHLLEGRELGRVLWSHCATFERITGVPAGMSQSGTEPPLTPETRTRLFSIAHNALTNAFLHARPGRVKVSLSFEAGRIRLSVSDDGVGLPDDYAEQGRGFDGMKSDAERMGGTLMVESARGGGTTISCVVPPEYEADLRTCLQSLKYDKLRRLPEGGVIMSHSYPSDISREQFTRILPDLESARRRTKPRTVDLHDVFCGVLYLLKSGCQWRMLPADFPNWGTCYQYFQQWSERPDPEQESILEQVLKKIGWRGPEKQWSERAEQLLHRGLPERQEHGQRRAEGL